MIPKPLKGFLSELHKVTDEGQLNWEEGAPNAYYCNHKQFTLHMSTHFDADKEEASFNFMIKSAGKDAFFSVTDQEQDYNIMRNLFASVEVNAAGFDDIAKDFFT